MSTQHYAYTVIGVRLPAEKLFPDRITNKRGCEHPLPVGARFCPNCGAAAYISEKQRGVIDSETGLDLKVWKGFGVLVGTSTFDPNVYVGLVVGNVRGQEYATRHDISFDAIELMHRQLKRTLAPMNLWDESIFGLWTVMYVNH